MLARMSTFSCLLEILTTSLSSASASLPESSTFTPPASAEGLSLLNTKNELLLSYLQNVVFLIILKLRGNANENNPEDENLENSVTQKLVELRIYLEKGVRPLESRLKYQIDKLLLAASEATPTIDATNGPLNPPKPKERDTSLEDPSPNIPDLAYRPNPSALTRPFKSSNLTAKDVSGVYKPPRITPTSLPTTDRKSKPAAKPRKSATLEAFVREEMDDAPVAEMSIGAGSGLKGRAKEREEERKGYEEQRLIRLPGEKKNKRRRGAGEDLLGGLGDFEREGKGEKRIKRGLGKKGVGRNRR